MRPKIGAAKLPILPIAHGEAAFSGDQFSQGESQCLGEISTDTSIRTQVLPMTVPEVSSIGQ